jgi:hypothetical protein
MQLLSPLEVSRDSGAGACEKTCPPCIAACLERAEALHSPSLFTVYGPWFVSLSLDRTGNRSLSLNVDLTTLSRLCPLAASGFKLD